MLTQHVYRYLDRRSAKPIAARQEVSLLSHLFTKAIRWGAVAGNPCRGVERPPPARRRRYVTDAEYAAVRAVAPAMIRIAMDLALLTGLRRGDLLALRHADCGPDAISVRTQKTGRALAIERTPAVSAVLAASLQIPPEIPRTYVLRTRTGRPYSAAGFSAIWQRCVQRAMRPGRDGAPPLAAGFTFHDIRAKSASDSASTAEAQERLGHASPATTETVYRRAPRRVRPLR